MIAQSESFINVHQQPTNQPGDATKQKLLTQIDEVVINHEREKRQDQVSVARTPGIDARHHQRDQHHCHQRAQSDGELHPGEVVEEKISLSERFGLWVSFYPFDQDEYLAIVAHWLESFGCSRKDVEQSREEALQWFLRTAEADIDGITDAEDRITELS